MLRLSLVLLLCLSAACKCNRPPGNVDAGPPPPECTLDLECPLGEVCDEGTCRRPGSLDASAGCQDDSQCPMGQRCLRSAGICVDPTDSGMLDPDAGLTGECFEGQAQSCGSSKLGECRLGLASCVLVGSTWQFGPCVGAIDAVPETCNGKDDDCDGDVDDGLGDVSCGTGDCARTVAACVGGQNIACTAGMPSAEVCDGRDNNCNGMTDELLAPATCGIGACARSVPSCMNGMSQTCTPGTPAAMETCNGIDDNCDGTVDEGFGMATCGTGACVRAVQSCVNGVPQICTPGVPGTETCNMIDDNCNGTTDEGCACLPGATQSCYGGPAGTAGVGRCTAGSQFCDAGMWGPCAGEVRPAPIEACNSIDDDCDNATDEGLGTTPCGLGACARTVSACIGGMPGVCVPGDAGVESCNGIDDDCDGTPDDGLPPVMCGQGVCFRSIASCVNGMTQNCVPGPPGTEICNGLDDNCNGSTDETYPQNGQACATGVPGPCGTGVYQCVTGALSCRQTVMPAMEICLNGIDENCNNIIDDPLLCGCSMSIDRDLDTYNECRDCNDNDGAIHPDAGELCNGKDDNCTGTIDEGFDVDMDGFTTCGTIPGPTGGIDPRRIDCNDSNNFVFPLKVTDCGNAATPNTANNVDDNCNGYRDETCSCTAMDKDNDGVTTCAGDCNDNDATIAPNRTEVCDGKDNDCNQATLDNCGVSDPCGVRSGPSYVPFAPGTDRCRPDLVCVTVVATGELVCGSYCNQTVGTGLNDSCAATEGCFTRLIDSDNLHLCAVRPVGAKTTGQACTAASECRTTDCHTDVTTYCSDKCTHEASCSASTTCTIVRTMTTVGPPPRTISDFSAYCRLDANIPGTKTTGQTCTGSECRTGPEGCFNGRCTEPCCQHTDCPAGNVCSINGPRVSIQGGAQVSAVPACLASTAMRISGQACATNAECKSGICEKTRSVCVDLCCNDLSCPNGTTCEPLELRLTGGQVLDVARVCLFSPIPAFIEQK